MLKSGAEDIQDSNTDGVIRRVYDSRGVGMHIQLPGYGDSRGFDSANETDLAAISKRVCWGFPKPPWPTLKHHLLILSVPKKLLRAIRALCVTDKKSEFKKERLLQRVARIHMSKTSNGLFKIDFVDGGEGATFPHIQDSLPTYPMITFTGWWWWWG